MMEKMKMSTPDLTDMNIAKIGALFPNVITETRDENGDIKKAVDFDLLRQVLSKSLVEDENERYRLDWPGKKASLLKANTPITKTLRPCREESVNFETTENLYIEGDNFEVLKILQESYLGKIKMIYIDPPYNTGNDFIYRDNFSKNKDEYEQDLGLTDEEGGKLFRNTDANGRYHSDWLSMMYERLVVARDLLKDDGVIFISIDDNEVHNLRKICDEIYGEENFITQFCWEKKKKPSFLNRNLGTKFEYILVFSKHREETCAFSIELTTEGKRFPINNAGNSLAILYFPPRSVKFSMENQYVFPQDMSEGKIITKLLNGFHIENGNNIESFSLEGEWRYSQETLNDIISNNEEILISKIPFRPNHIKAGGEIKKMHNLLTIAHYSVATNEDADSEQVEVFGKNYFDYAKPSELIKLLMKAITYHQKDDIILDFFSGSATTAHAVMQLNAEDGGNRKFIMVQLPEPCDENSEAFKAGYKNIAEIGKERIRRAGKKIVEELKNKNQQLELGEEPVDLNKLDIGFRVYKTDTSNLKDVFYHPSELDQGMLSSLESNIKEDRTPEDLLTQVLLDLGLELTLPIETKQMFSNTVYIVQTNALIACFDENVDFRIVDQIADLKPLRVVFKDASFINDKDRINVEERFKRLSPETKATVI